MLVSAKRVSKSKKQLRSMKAPPFPHQMHTPRDSLIKSRLWNQYMERGQNLEASNNNIVLTNHKHSFAFSKSKMLPFVFVTMIRIAFILLQTHD